MTDAAAALAADERARHAALDPTRSWLVQAPAGSGKTGLLIQRYLALLARVESPERVVAMTFTRKAAAEMRERVQAALADAAAGDAPQDAREPAGADALTPHARRTRELAQAALAQDRRHEWRLIEHPARLRIDTIDAFTASLARAAPLSTGLGALPAFVDDATELYRAAARSALASAGPDDPTWRTFLQWLDNDARVAVDLLSAMLASRDRWPAGMLSQGPPVLRAMLEQVLSDEICAELARVRQLFPAALTNTLAQHAADAVRHLDGREDAAERIAALRALATCGELPEPGPHALRAWRALADWMLTQKGAFLRGVKDAHGFPPVGGGPGADMRRHHKAAFFAWLQDAERVPGLAAALHGVRQLPPERFGEDAWSFVAATLAILPQAAAHLLLVMAAERKADFAEATLRALQALGPGDMPSDLLLALDERIEHLLVDEFQDTSAAQLSLITRLTAGWQPGDGRTLFAVGDPMQSIYRFRNAEVRIFVAAQAAARIGDVAVGTLELARNFRSRAGIVQWVNEVFANVLPPSSNAARSEVAYRAAHPHDSRDDPAPTVDLCGDRRAEAAAVVRRIASAQADGVASIAVLVRARSHVADLLPALRDAGIAYQAVELEPLHERLPTRDLVSLARALSQPADRLAWLAVLRAPWCGLSLADLLALAGARDERPMTEALADDATLGRLSSDGERRARRFRDAIAPSLAARGRASFSLRVRAAWLALGGPGIADAPLDRDGADRLFTLLDQHERAGDLADFDAFAAATERLFAAPAASTADVQLMTLHKAKGLEFDAVILPGLDRATQGESPRLLRWKVRGPQGSPALVLAPVKARTGANAQPDPVYEWLGLLDAAEEVAELGRLLYVGATRARHRLHLVAVADVAPRDDAASAPSWRRPGKGSALERLWDAVAHRLGPPASGGPEPLTHDSSATTGPAPAASPAAVSTRVQMPITHIATTQRAAVQMDLLDTPAGVDPSIEPAPVPALLQRIALDWTMPAPLATLSVEQAAAGPASGPAFDWAAATAAAVGTVAHRWVAQIAREGMDRWPAARVTADQPRVIAALAGAGVPSGQRAAAARRVAGLLMRTLEDPRGRWLLDPRHAERRVEWPLAGVDGGQVVHVALDHTFIAEGARWIVDLKTSAHEGAGQASFLDAEVERYRPQLERYARLVGAMDPRPIRIALYYPLIEDGFREISAAGLAPGPDGSSRRAWLGP